MVEFQRIERAPRIVFIEQNGDGPGVRIKGKSKRRGSLRPDQLNAENDG